MSEPAGPNLPPSAVPYDSLTPEQLALAKLSSRPVKT
jgi:hypothetical protein